MSRSAFSARLFSVYLFVVGLVLIVNPNALLAIFHMPPPTDVWIRVVGVTVFNIGVFAWNAAKYENRPFFVVSVYTRSVVFAAFTAFAVMGLASPTIVLFGVIDLLGAVWTRVSLNADARLAASGLQTQ